MHSESVFHGINCAEGYDTLVKSPPKDIFHFENVKATLRYCVRSQEWEKSHQPLNLALDPRPIAVTLSFNRYLFLGIVLVYFSVPWPCLPRIH